MGKKASLFKKVASIGKRGFDPLRKGRGNYNRNLPAVEEKARERSKTCLGCENYVDEPVKSFQVEETRIPALSKKMCDECGCPLSYLLRQNVKICKKWKE